MFNMMLQIYNFFLIYANKSLFFHTGTKKSALSMQIFIEGFAPFSCGSGVRRRGVRR